MLQLYQKDFKGGVNMCFLACFIFTSIVGVILCFLYLVEGDTVRAFNCLGIALMGIIPILEIYTYGKLLDKKENPFEFKKMKKKAVNNTFSNEMKSDCHIEFATYDIGVPGYYI